MIKDPLAGKTIAIKDNIVTTEHPTTAASKILAKYRSPFDATVVKLLRENGATLSAGSNMDEFGMGSHSQNSHTGPVVSPYRRGGVRLSPGGSSGGSAIAVLTEECWAALGTDTGGSVRLPAAYTGTVGFKPSYGLISRWGVIQYANSMDTVGILAQNTSRIRDVFTCINRFDSQDPTSLSPSFCQRMQSSTTKAHATGSLRIGIPLEYNIHELSPVVRESYISTLELLQSAGHTLHPVSLPSTRLALSAYYVLAPAEASSNLAKYDGIRYGHRTSGSDASPSADPALPLYAATRGEGFGDEVQRRILLGAYTLSSAARDNYFVQAQKVRRLVQQDFDRVFARVNPLLDGEPRGFLDEGKTNDEEEGKIDVLVTPTAPTLPPTIDEVQRQSPVESYMNDVFTVPASLAGLPAASVPVKLRDSSRREMEETDIRTASLQIIGQFGDDELVLRVAEAVEKTQASS